MYIDYNQFKQKFASSSQPKQATWAASTNPWKAPPKPINTIGMDKTGQMGIIRDRATSAKMANFVTDQAKLMKDNRIQNEKLVGSIVNPIVGMSNIAFTPLNAPIAFLKQKAMDVATAGGGPLGWLNEIFNPYETFKSLATGVGKSLKGEEIPSMYDITKTATNRLTNKLGLPSLEETGTPNEILKGAGNIADFLGTLVGPGAFLKKPIQAGLGLATQGTKQLAKLGIKEGEKLTTSTVKTVAKNIIKNAPKTIKENPKLIQEAIETVSKTSGRKVASVLQKTVVKGLKLDKSTAKLIKPGLHEVLNVKGSMEHAAKLVKTNPMKMLNKFRSGAYKDADYHIVGQELISHFAAKPKSKVTENIISEVFNGMENAATAQGQAFNVLSQLAKRTPQGFIRAAESQGVKMTPEMVTDIYKTIKASKKLEGLAQEKAIYALMKRIGNTVKASAGENIAAYRYGNMLSNIVQTSGRNVISSLLNIPANIAEKAISGTMGSVARKVGIETGRTISELPAYVGGLLKTIPIATRRAWARLVDAIPSESMDIMEGARLFPKKMNKITEAHNLVLRFYDAQDTFFQTLFRTGEEKSLQAIQKATGKEIKNLMEIAKQRGAAGVFKHSMKEEYIKQQGKVFQGIDHINKKLTSFAMEHPSTRWVVPFINVPSNVLKESIKFVPGFGQLASLGQKTGNYVQRFEALSKQIIGAGAMMTILPKVVGGEVTFDYPLDKKESQRWDESGIKPYSVKIGNNWYSYQNMGPVGMIFAVPAAIKYYSNEAKTIDSATKKENLLANANNMVGGIVKFMSTQSYLTGVKNVMDAVMGGGAGLNMSPDALERLVISTGTQLIPFNSMLAAIGRSLDPYQRNSKELIDKIWNSIPFGTQMASPKLNREGQPITREDRLYGLTSPLKRNPQTDIYNVPRWDNEFLNQFIAPGQQTQSGPPNVVSSGTNNMQYTPSPSTYTPMNLQLQPYSKYSGDSTSNRPAINLNINRPRSTFKPPTLINR